MNSFLQLLAEDLIRKYQYNLKDLTVLFPNKRAGLFLAEALSKRIGQPIWMPAILTLPEFIERQTGLKTADNLPLIIKLYKAYTQVSGSTERFEDFYFWGNMLLGDFDDIDKYLADPQALFSNIISLKEVEINFPYLSPEQIDAVKSFWSSFNPEKYSLEQQEFLKVWNNLYPTYLKFKERLFKENLCYEGMGQRFFYEHIENYAQKTPVIFAGFNALNKCEKQIFTFYKNNKQATFYWDYDIYYTSNEFHEAGNFIRENLTLFPNELGPEHFNNFKYNGKNIEYISVPSNIGQAKLILTLLNDASRKNPRKTALVLCDERLLIPVMHSIPEDISKINITMGYPAQNTSVAALLYMLGELKNYSKTENDNTYYYYKPVIALLNHKLIKDSCPEDIDKITDYIRKKNIVYIAGKNLHFNALTRVIFSEEEQNIPDYLLRILKLLSASSPDTERTLYPLEKEFIFTFYTQIQCLKNTFEEEKIVPENKLYLQIINKIVNTTTIPFSGEPLEGLQIMGLQETRMLDFDNLILFSANEGIIPHTGHISSFIPYNLRVGFQLPTPEHQDALFAYYFYRVLQRARQIKILYNSVTQGLSGGEKSRFLLQMKYESGLPITEHNFQNHISVEEARKIEIVYNKEILDTLYAYTQSPEISLSPSALNIYIDCPLRFYFKYIAGIKEKEEMAEELDQRLLGNIFHECSQSLYATVAEQEITADVINRILHNREQLDKHIRKSYLNFYDSQVIRLIDSGSNELILEVIKKYLRQMFQYDKTICPFRIISMEKRYTVPIPINTPNGLKSVYIGGIIDRIDQIDHAVRIIDYKTGADTTVFRDIPSIFDPTDNNRNKAAFQTLLYCLMFGYNHPQYPVLTPGIYSTKLLFGKDYNYKLKCNNSYISDFSAYREDFYQLLTELLSRLFSSDNSFTQTLNEKKCRTCPYSGICRK